MYISWIDENVLEQTTFPRYTSVYSWPLSKIQFYRKKREVLQQLTVFEWKSKTTEEVATTVNMSLLNVCYLIEYNINVSYYWNDLGTSREFFNNFAYCSKHY